MLSHLPVIPNTFAHTSPYGGCWLEYFYRSFSRDLYGEKIITESHFRDLASEHRMLPALLIEGNLVVERHALRSLCWEAGINRITSEDGFFPHYSTLHADPLGFAWESSLSRMVFRNCAQHQRERSRENRQRWLEFERMQLPTCVKEPFVLWPLQLLGDNVNVWDLAMPSWVEVVQHFRRCLPREFGLVLKRHPRAKPADEAGLELLVSEMPNAFLIGPSADLKSLLGRCAAVAGVNSTVLLEARLMFLKPVFAYGRSWFTSHSDLIVPVSARFSERLPGRFDLVEHPERLKKEEYLLDYADWFLYQLLIRQLTHDAARENAELLQKFVDRLSFHSYMRDGEAIFE